MEWIPICNEKYHLKWSFLLKHNFFTASREGTGSETGRGVLERAMIIDLHQNQIKVS